MSELIKRKFVLYASEIEIDDFINMRIDYSEIGNLSKRIAQLHSDYDAIGFRSIMTGQRDAIDAAYIKYLRELAKE